MQTVTIVKTLDQIEIKFSLLISAYFLKEIGRQRQNEYCACGHCRRVGDLGLVIGLRIRDLC